MAELGLSLLILGWISYGGGGRVLFMLSDSGLEINSV